MVHLMNLRQYGYKSEDFAEEGSGLANAQMGCMDQLIYHSCNGSLGSKEMHCHRLVVDNKI